MATTPFATTAVTYSGQSAGRRVRDTPAGLRGYWLGRPGNLIQLPGPRVVRDSTVSSGESAHTSADGTTTVFRRTGPARRAWTLEWDRLTGRDWQIVNGFYRRMFGAGPWAFLQPEDANCLDENVTLCGDVSAWSEVGAGSIAVAAAASPLLPSGVLQWTGPAAGDRMFMRPLTSTSALDVSGAVPYLPAEPLTLSVWLAVTTGTRQVRLRASGRNPAAAAVTEPDTLVTLTTTWQRFTLTVAAGGLTTSTYVVPALVAVGTGGDYLVAAPQLEYAAAAADWQAGAGVPRVVWTDPPPRSVDARLRSTTAMVLAE